MTMLQQAQAQTQTQIHKVKPLPASVTESYILDMLQELTTIAQKADLKDLASMLAITSAAARMDVGSKA